MLRPGGGETLPAFEPVYPLTQGLTLRTVTRAAQDALTRLPDLPEWIEPSLKRQRRWPDWQAAVRAAHAPRAPPTSSRPPPPASASPMTSSSRTR